MLYGNPATETLGVAVFIVGCILVVVSLAELGQSASVGLPERETDLKTRGLYGFIRNPVYVGGFLMCIGACLHALHVVNLLLFAIAVAVYLQIVSKEEAVRTEVVRCKRRVPGYVGRIRK